MIQEGIGCFRITRVEQIGAVVLCFSGWMVEALDAGVGSHYRGRWCMHFYSSKCVNVPIYVEFDGVQYSTVCTCTIIGLVQHVVDSASTSWKPSEYVV